jgi:hypothetical protein
MENFVKSFITNTREELAVVDTEGNLALEMLDKDGSGLQ